MYRTLLTVHSTEDPVELLSPVVELARAFEAHIEARVINLLSPIPTMIYAEDPDFVWPDSFDDLYRQTSQREREARKLFEQCKVSAEVIGEAHQLNLVDTNVAQSALSADLAIVNTGQALDRGLMAEVLDGTLFHAGRPTLVLRNLTHSPPVAPDRVTIAWNGSREAARALDASLPFLHRAAEVRLLLVGEEPGSKVRRSAKALGPYLARHDITIQIDVEAVEGRDVTGSLIEHLTSQQPDLIVMGAYGHSRFRERLLSGATIRALTELDTPLLLAH